MPSAVARLVGGGARIGRAQRHGPAGARLACATGQLNVATSTRAGAARTEREAATSHALALDLRHTTSDRQRASNTTGRAASEQRHGTARAARARTHGDTHRASMATRRLPRLQ